MLSEKSVVDQIEVTILGTIQVRRADLVLRDGVEIAKSYHRHVLEPGDDLSGHDKRVIAIAAAIWTPDVINEFIAWKAAQLPASKTTQEK